MDEARIDYTLGYVAMIEAKLAQLSEEQDLRITMAGGWPNWWFDRDSYKEA